MLLPPRLVAAASQPVVLLGARLNRASPERAHAISRHFRALLGHADRLLADGVLDAYRPNAATLRVAAGVALLERLEDVRPMLAGRPVTRLASRAGTRLASTIFPDYPGRIPAGCLRK